ncbi:unnamed protein product [Rhodiola kirilowii]
MANEFESILSPTVISVSGGGSDQVDDPYYIYHNQITGRVIVSKVLIGHENYVVWKKSMEIALSGRLELSFIEGKYPKPTDVVMAARWQMCNDVLMS